MMSDLLSTLMKGSWNADIGGIQFFLWLTLATVIYSRKLEKRTHWKLRAGISILMVSVLALLIPPYQMNSSLGTQLWFQVMYFVNVAVILSYCKVSVLEAFSCASYGSLTEHIASSIYVSLLAMDMTSNITYTVISLAVYAAAWFMVGRKMAAGGHFRALGIRKILTCVMTVMVVTVLSYGCKAESGLFALQGIESEGLRRMLLYSQGYSIAFCLAMLAMEYHSEMQLRAQAQLAVSHELIHLREKEFRLTKENVDLINRKCHDMKHQVSLLMEQGGAKAEMRERYAQDIIKSIEVYDSSIQTGNEILNIVLMDKSLYCSMHGIVWTCMAQGDMLNFVEDMDLAALIGNALDNAVEAVERIEDPKKRFIGVQIGKKGQFAQIRVENSYDGQLILRNNSILTRKSDKEYHGFGIASIRDTAAKYDGSASVLTEGDTFVLSVLIPLPNALFIACLDQTAEMAELMGDTERSACYREAAVQARIAWNELFIDPETGMTRNTKGVIEDTQASYATPLRFGVISEENLPRVLAHYRRTIETPNATDSDGLEVPPYSITTGFNATGNVLPALSRYGMSDIAYRLFESTEYASWLYPVTQGATSIWERWNGYTNELGFNGNNGMNSFNHYSFGACYEWMMAYQLGISSDSANPGYQHFIFQPTAGGSFTYAKGSYESAYGTIFSGWTAENGMMTGWDGTVPANTTATLYLPATGDILVCEGAAALGTAVHNGTDVTVIELSAGSWHAEIADGQITLSSGT